MAYEHKSRKLISRRRFVLRMLLHVAVSASIVVLSIAIGMMGYEHYEHLSWRDALLNTTMLLGGMGPVNPPQTPGGKLFASFFALYAGLVFIAVTGVLLAPAAHRVFHHLHFDDDGSETSKPRK